MAVVPTATAVTMPFAEIEAMAGLLLDQLTWRSVRMFPLASRTVAVSVLVRPTIRVTGLGAIATLATAGRVTISEIVAVLPSHAAVITTCPGATAVTRPVVETVATELLLVVHVTA
jgi:hypothetical protein